MRPCVIMKQIDQIELQFSAYKFINTWSFKYTEKRKKDKKGGVLASLIVDRVFNCKRSSFDPFQVLEM